MKCHVVINLYVHTHNDILITWISGLATSREMFWFSSLVSNATASSRFRISTPLILKEKEGNIRIPDPFKIICLYSTTATLNSNHLQNEFNVIKC